jgi:hypothetical protein
MNYRPYKINLRGIILIALIINVAIIVAFLYCFDVEFYILLTKIGILLSLNFICWRLFNRRIWRIPFIRKYLFDNIPDINGRWEGQIDREGEDGVHSFVLEIKQTLLDIYANGYTSSGGGPSMSIHLCTDSDNSSFFLIYNWICETKNKINNVQSGMFWGTSILKILPDNTIEGEYFTGRKPYQTRGVTTVNFKCKELKGKH